MIWAWCKFVILGGKKEVSSWQILLIREHSSDLDTHHACSHQEMKPQSFDPLQNANYEYYTTLCEIPA